MKISIHTSSFGQYDPTPLHRLKTRKIKYILNPYGRKLNKQEVISLSRGVQGIVAGTENLDRNVLLKLPGLKVISRCGVGLDNIDLDVARTLGIQVFVTNDAPTMAVAELTIGMIFDLLRNISSMNQKVKAGAWEKQMGHLLFGKKIGIIGFGKIGQKVAELMPAFNVQLAYYDVRRISVAKTVPFKNLNSLLGWADIVTLHVSSEAMGLPLVGKKEISRMKRGSWLINTSRGNVIDEKAICDALKSGHLAGVAIDAFNQEPYRGPLTHFPQAILTPHIGSYALESRVQMEKQAVENLIRGLK